MFKLEIFVVALFATIAHAGAFSYRYTVTPANLSSRQASK